MQGTLDAFFHKLHSDRIGIQVNHAVILTKEGEQKLWETGVMCLSSPRSLQNAVFFTVGKMSCLREGVEHRSLKLSQLKQMNNPDRYIYYKNVSKNRQGFFKQLHVPTKVVPVYACPEAAGEKCPVHVLDKYLSELPRDYSQRSSLCSFTVCCTNEPQCILVLCSTHWKRHTTQKT